MFPTLEYITKVDACHVVKVNGTNVRVLQDLTGFTLYNPYDTTLPQHKIVITYVKGEPRVTVSDMPFTAIVAAVAIVSFIKEQTK